MRVLMLVNGLGLGNSTRCHAVIERLVARGASVHVVTSGNGVWYLGQHLSPDQITAIEAFWYARGADGALNAWGTVGAARQFWAIARRNEATIAEVIARFRPDVAVVDSVYTVCALRRAKVPVVAINNADVVVGQWGRFSDRPASIAAQYHLIEKNDLRFHLATCARIISPTLDPGVPKPGSPAVRRVGPLVRSGFTPTAAEAQPRVVVMLSGSTFGSPITFRNDPGVRVDVLGREGRGPGDVVFHGKVPDTRAFLRGASLVVVNGGFSAVSEVFALRVPMIVVPVPRHAEQWVNARTIVDLGVGWMTDEADVEATIARATGSLAVARAAYERLPIMQDGAEQAADIITGVLAK